MPRTQASANAFENSSGSLPGMSGPVSPKAVQNAWLAPSTEAVDADEHERQRYALDDLALASLAVLEVGLRAVQRRLDGRNGLGDAAEVRLGFPELVGDLPRFVDVGEQYVDAATDVVLVEAGQEVEADPAQIGAVERQLALEAVPSRRLPPVRRPCGPRRRTAARTPPAATR